MFTTDDVRIENLRPLIPPAILMEEIPVSDAMAAQVIKSRQEIAGILHGVDPRWLLVMGPCSIHDPKAGFVYAQRLKELAERQKDVLLVVMRAYFEKPRTTVGWKGLINDPHIDESYAVNQGLRLARGFLRDVTALGLPVGTEFLDPITPQFIADFVAWAAIGARTVESQVHRELASGLSMPIGFKNATTGSITVAVDAVEAARHPHHFLSVTKQGVAAIVATRGNTDAHVILRGGQSGPNFDAASVTAAQSALSQRGLSASVLVDCSHANSGRDPLRQVQVAKEVVERAATHKGVPIGLMLESFLVPGRQDAVPGHPLVFGQSITDPCLGWDETLALVDHLADVLRRARG